MKNFKKILLTTLPILFIFLTINIVRADTFTYNDPSLRIPADCTGFGGNQCTDNGDRTIFANIDYQLIFNHNTRILNENLPISYQICNPNIGSCYDGNNSAVYGGNSKFYLKASDFNSLTLKNNPDTGISYSIGCSSGSSCSYPDQKIKSGETATWTHNITNAIPSLPQQTAGYSSNLTFTPSLDDGRGNLFTLQSVNFSDDVLITFDYVDPCDKIFTPETEQTIACGEGYYFQLTSSTTQYKINDVYGSKVIRDYTCEPNNSFGSIAQVTIKFKCPTDPILKIR